MGVREWGGWRSQKQIETACAHPSSAVVRHVARNGDEKETIDPLLLLLAALLPCSNAATPLLRLFLLLLAFLAAAIRLQLLLLLRIGLRRPLRTATTLLLLAVFASFGFLVSTTSTGLFGFHPEQGIHRFFHLPLRGSEQLGVKASSLAASSCLQRALTLRGAVIGRKTFRI